MKHFYTLLIEHKSLSALLLLACVFLLYANALDNAFQYDDRHSIVENPHIRDLGNIPAFFSQAEYFSRDADKAMYRPFVLVTLALNYAWSGYETYSYHLVNTAIHSLCVLLVWGILLRLGRPPCMALFGALLFAVHPLCSEPVNYISSRSELLAALGALAALWSFMLNSERRSALLTCFSLLCFAIGLFSKSVAIVMPLWLMVWDVQRGAPINGRRYAPYVGIALLYLLIVREFVARAVLNEPVRSWFMQAGTQAKALVYYVYLTFSPVSLSAHHAFSESPMSEPLVWLCAVLLLSMLWWAYRLRAEYLGLALALSALLPTLIVPLNVLVNEHRLYLPVAGMAIALSGLRGLERLSGLAWGAPLLISLGFLLSMQRNEVWQDEYSLWQDVALKNPHAVRPYVYMGNAMRRDGNSQEALPYYQRALDNDSANPVARAGLAAAYRDLGRLDEAIAEFERAIVDAPQMRDLHYSLGRVLQQASRYEKARQHYLALPAESPHYGIALNNLGTLHELEGRGDSALHYYARSRRLGVIDAKQNLQRLTAKVVQQVEVELQRGDVQRAELLCRQILAADAGHLYARFFLAISLFEQRRYRESIAENRALLLTFPEFGDGHLQLANALETAGRLEEAQQVYQTLLVSTANEELRRLGQERLRRLQERMP